MFVVVSLDPLMKMKSISALTSVAVASFIILAFYDLAHVLILVPLPGVNMRSTS